MRDILQTINRDKESKQWLSHGIVLGTALGIIIFVLFDGISMLSKGKIKSLKRGK